jgi:hypothetical protein
MRVNRGSLRLRSLGAVVPRAGGLPRTDEARRGGRLRNAVGPAAPARAAGRPVRHGRERATTRAGRARSVPSVRRSVEEPRSSPLCLFALQAPAGRSSHRSAFEASRHHRHLRRTPMHAQSVERLIAVSMTCLPSCTTRRAARPGRSRASTGRPGRNHPDDLEDQGSQTRRGRHRHPRRPVEPAHRRGQHDDQNVPYAARIARVGHLSRHSSRPGISPGMLAELVKGKRDRR